MAELTKKLQRQGMLWMVLSSLGFACMGACVKYITTELPPGEAVFFRFALNALLLLPYMLVKKISLFGNNQKILFMRSTCGFIAGTIGFYVTANIPLADAYLLNYSSPVFVAVLAAIFFKEKPPVLLFAYIGLAILGASCIIKPGFGVFNIFGLWGLASAFFAALAYLGVKESHKTDSPFTVVFHFSVFATIAAWILFHDDFRLPTALLQWVALLGAGVFGTIAQCLLTYAYKHSDASRISPYAYSVVIFSAILGFVFFGEVPDVFTFVGGTCMVVAGVGILHLEKQNTFIRQSLRWLLNLPR